ncbi:leucine-rich repeat domain-containing protein [Chaetoceros tenuissimus]|uniref:Leucine-rich repeat domain-containing protein n=1 Tax=Chaetoceros tenuissimus TaxID=426638 RepID=A0AAD3D2B2_9STRA|nr:leucine-rich repeat domain-containing protein [Chaetoceros tenuissimus]
MRVQTEEWRRFIPGVRTYKGKKTLFYNGEELWDDENDEYLIYSKEERQTWEVIIVLPGVEVIPARTLNSCTKVKSIIMSDTVKRIEGGAISLCTSLVFVKLSRNLEFIGEAVFLGCHSLPYIFIPSSCREIGGWTFQMCTKLIILVVPRHTTLGHNLIGLTTTLSEICKTKNNEEINEWIRNRHVDDQFALHRVCSSDNPLMEEIYEIVKQQGLAAWKKPDSIGMTPSKYLAENPFTEIKEEEIIRRYINKMMG